MTMLGGERFEVIGPNQRKVGRDRDVMQVYGRWPLRSIALDATVKRLLDDRLGETGCSRRHEPTSLAGGGLLSGWSAGTGISVDSRNAATWDRDVMTGVPMKVSRSRRQG